jgi:hypothetical protein
MLHDEPTNNVPHVDAKAGVLILSDLILFLPTVEADREA